MKDVLVIVSADPRSSDRALDALRMCVGLTLAENRVRVLVRGEAQRLVDPQPGAFPDALRAREYLSVLEKRDVPVVSGADPTEAARSADAVIWWGE